MPRPTTVIDRSAVASDPSRRSLFLGNASSTEIWAPTAVDRLAMQASAAGTSAEGRYIPFLSEKLKLSPIPERDFYDFSHSIYARRANATQSSSYPIAPRSFVAGIQNDEYSRAAQRDASASKYPAVPRNVVADIPNIQRPQDARVDASSGLIGSENRHRQVTVPSSAGSQHLNASAASSSQNQTSMSSGLQQHNSPSTSSSASRPSSARSWADIIRGGPRRRAMPHVESGSTAATMLQGRSKKITAYFPHVSDPLVQQWEISAPYMIELLQNIPFVVGPLLVKPINYGVIMLTNVSATNTDC